MLHRNGAYIDGIPLVAKVIVIDKHFTNIKTFR
jgi:hypothetical protein